MATRFTAYNRQTFFANLRANGYQCTAEEEEYVDRVIRDNSQDNDILSMIRQAITGAVKFVRGLLGMRDPDASVSDRVNAGLNAGDRFSGQREINESLHSIYDVLSAPNMSDNIRRLAAAVTGQTNTGVPVMNGNLFQVGMGPLAPTRAELQQGTRLDPGAAGFQPVRYPVADIAENSPPLATSSTRALTGYTQGA